MIIIIKFHPLFLNNEKETEQVLAFYSFGIWIYIA